MTKGSYRVGENPSEHPQHDTSFRSFICALLVFLCICLIILLASINWSSGKSNPNSENLSETSAQKGEFEAEIINKDENNNQTFEKIKLYETTTEQYYTKNANKEVQETIRANDKATNVPIPVTQKFSESTTSQITTINNRDELNTEKPSTFINKVEAMTISSKKDQDLTTSSSTVGSNLDQQLEQAENFDFTFVQKEIEVETTTSSNVQNNKSATDDLNFEATFPTTYPTTSTSNSNKTENPTITNFTEVVTTTINIQEETSTFGESNEPVTRSEMTETSPKSTTTKIVNFFKPLKTTTTSTTTSTTSTEASIMESEAESFTQSSFSSSLLAKSSKPVCETVACKTISSRMLSMMNHSAEPCDDFYEFACGNFYKKEEDSREFLQNKIIETELNKISDSSPKFLTDFKNFHQSCLNHEKYFNYSERIESLQQLLEDVGQFNFSNSAPVDITDLVSALILRQSMPLFDIGLDVDKQSSNFILQLNLPHQSFLRTGIENWSAFSLIKSTCLQEQTSQLHNSFINLNNVYKLFQNCQFDYASYLNSVETVVREVEAFKNLEENELFAEIKNLRFSIEFEVLNNLDTLPTPDTILKNFIDKNYNIRKISDLQVHYPIFEWKRLFASITKHEITDNTLVQVYFNDYFNNVFTKLHRVDKHHLYNAFLAIYAHSLFINGVISKETSNRRSFCNEISTKLFPDVWNYFVGKSFLHKEHQNQKLTALFEELKQNFCRSLLSAEWIDENTKPAVLKKCNALNISLFKAPKELEIEKNFDNLNLSTNYQRNLISVLTNHKQIIYSLERTPLSADTLFSYFVDGLSDKPLTFYANPLIVVPLGLMKDSYFGLPDYLVKTRIGFSLARQMARHFDSTGIKYGVNLKSTSRSTYSEFVHTMTNLMDYSSPRLFNHKNISFHLNGSLSVNERVVDNTAFRLIYDSINFSPDADLLPWIEYSREKVFFIAAAQSLCKRTSMLDFMLQVFEQRHLPAVLRVENIIGNSEQFAKQFSCPDGSGMDFPEKLQFPFLPIMEEQEEYEDDDLQQS